MYMCVCVYADQQKTDCFAQCGRNLEVLTHHNQDINCIEVVNLPETSFTNMD